MASNVGAGMVGWDVNINTRHVRRVSPRERWVRFQQ